MASSTDIWTCLVCTVHNPLDAVICTVCDTARPITSAPSDDFNDKSEQSDQVSDEDEEFDMTQYDDSQENHANNNNNNNNNKREKTAIKTYPTEILELSDENINGMYDENDDENDDESDDEDMREARRLSMISHKNEDNMRRVSAQDAHNSSIIGDHPDLFGSYSANTNNSNNVSDNEDIDMNDNNRKRKRNIQNDIESPPKKRKIDDENNAKKHKRKKRKKKKKNKQNNDINDINIQNINLNHNNNNNNNNNNNLCDDIPILNQFEKVDPEKMIKKDRNRIEKGYEKFKAAYIKGAFCLRTVCIEYGPKFKGRSAASESKEFTKILSDTSWRTKGLAKLIPEDMAFESCNNMSLPQFVCRFKHYTVNTTDKSLIFNNYNINENEIKKLDRYKVDGLAQYFLPRLMNKSRCEYSPHVMIRLNWNNFKKLWDQNKFVALIQQVKNLPNVKYINICLEGVAQNVAKFDNKNTQTGANGNSPFDNEQQLKARMTAYYFGDATYHFLYSRNQKETALHIIRVARSVAEHRFKKMRQNQLSISDHNNKGIKGKKNDKNKSQKDVFFSTLVGMHNLSEKKASGITNQYPTIKSLMNEYRRCSEYEGEHLLEDIRPPNTTSRLGPAISKRVYVAFYKNVDGDRKMNV